MKIIQNIDKDIHNQLITLNYGVHMGTFQLGKPIGISKMANIILAYFLNQSDLEQKRILLLGQNALSSKKPQ